MQELLICEIEKSNEVWRGDLMMKKFKIIRNVTLGLLIIFALVLGYEGVLQFLDGNYYSDILGITVFYWYERFFIELEFYLYIFGIPVIIDCAVCIYSIVKIKKFNNE